MSSLEQHAQAITDHLQNHIKEHGAMSFFDYMQFALYEPGLGYYSAGLHKFGPSGDFITAPEISALFSYSIAKQCREVLATLPQGDILEFGAGSGQMACDILWYLQENQALPQHYYILEISPDLRQRQQEKLAATLPDFIDRIIWLDTLPETFNGIMLANEVLDAMPVHLFEWNHQPLKEAYVTLEKNKLTWHFDTPTSTLQNAFEHLKKDINTNQWPEPYRSEINTLMPGWIKSVANCLNQGVLLMIDYGYPSNAYYHPQRNTGTLMCHHQHKAHSDPLIHCGLQDITAHVDFSLATESAVNAGLTLEGYTNQSSFLINCGIHHFLTDIKQPEKRPNESAAVKKLLFPGAMGELFKVIAFSNNYEACLMGFAENDLSRGL